MCPPPLEPNAQRKKSTEIKRLERTDSAKIAKIFNLIFLFFIFAKDSLKSTLQFGIRKTLYVNEKYVYQPPMRLLFLVKTDVSVT